MSREPAAAALHHRDDIDGLRALAVGAVILFHMAPTLLPGGFLGVDVFFVISGFLISSIILADIRRGTFSFVDFYLRRARRILPALLTMLLFAAAIAPLVLLPDELHAFAKSVVASVTFVPNIALLNEVGYFDVQADTKPLLHLWSLGVEEQFYLAWPAILVVAAGALRSRVLPASILIVGVASFLLAVLVSHVSAAASFYLPFTRFWELLVGALLAAIGHGANIPADHPRHVSAARSNVMSVGGLLLILSSMVLSSGTSTNVAVGAAPTIGAALFIAAGNRATINRTLFSARWVVYVGAISYPLYLFHWPLLSFLRILHLDDVTLDRLLRVAAVAVALLAAVLTYHLIEIPIRRRKDLRRIAPRLLAASTGVAAFGIAGWVAGNLSGAIQSSSAPFAWPASLRSEASCLDSYGQPPEFVESEFCVRNDPSRPPQVVLLGDSHANALWPGVEAAFEGNSVLQIGASACPYLRNVEFWVDGLPANRRVCPPSMAAAFNAIGEATRIVILNGRVAAYTAGPGPHEGPDYGVRGTLASSDLPGAAPLEIFRSALTRDLRMLVARGLDVVLVLQVPELDFSPRRCLGARPIDRFLPRGGRASCAMPRKLVVDRQAAYRNVVNLVVESLGDSRIHVVDPMDVMCDSQSCYALRDGNLLYRDEQHLSQAGSRYVWSRIQPDGLREKIR